jgi:limonene-1,2-epoxide hydrolase
MNVRAINVFEVEKGVITRWRDHADLAEVPLAEKDRWRRLSVARW